MGEVAPKLLDGLFGQYLVLLDKLEQVTASTILKDDPQVVPGLVPVVELEDVPVFQIMKDANLG